MNTEAERQMASRPRAIDYEAVSIRDRLTIPVTRDVPHHNAVAPLDELAAKFGVLQRCASHMRYGRLPTNHFRHEAVNQGMIAAQFLVLIGVLVERQHRACQRVARGIIAADDQKNDIAE